MTDTERNLLAALITAINRNADATNRLAEAHEIANEIAREDIALINGFNEDEALLNSDTDGEIH